MFVSFNKVFHPTDEEKKKQIEFHNKIIKEKLQENGENCRNCKNSLRVQESPYCDYLTCKLAKSTRVDNNEVYRCEKYEFCGYIQTTTREGENCDKD